MRNADPLHRRIRLLMLPVMLPQIVLAVTTTLCLFPCSAAWAGVEASINLPVPRFGGPPKRPSGLTMTVTSNWVEGNGYRPVHVEVRSAAPSQADRRLQVSLTLGNYYNGSSQQAVQFEMELPQGASRASHRVSVPQSTIWQRCDVEVREDGQLVDDLSEKLGWPRTTQNWEWTEAFPAILFISQHAPEPGSIGFRVNQMRAGRTEETDTYKLPNVRRFAFAISPTVDNTGALQSRIGTRRATDDDVLNILSQLSRFELLAPQAIPTRWIELTCFDLIVAPLDDLQQLAANHSDGWQAIRAYLRTGGTLIVYNVGDQFAQLNDLEQLLSFPAGGKPAVGESAQHPCWELPDPERFVPDARVLVGDPEYADSEEYYYEIDAEDADATPRRVRRSANQNPPTGDPKYMLREFGLGQVAAVALADLSDEQDPTIDWLMSQLQPDRWRWFQRHGMSSNRRNTDFWDFLIPGVGAAPVKVFLFIISAFVLIIGPVNYWSLRRSNRLYMLLITVPLGALLITSCLFAYAMFSDGFGTRTRLRSFSVIAPDQSEAVSWSRQSYYSGLSPSGGMVYPTSTVVYPLEYSPSETNAQRKLIRWSDTQHLASGYVRSRTTRQHLVINATPSSLNVDIQAADNEYLATNRLDVDLDLLVVVDNGQVYVAESLKPDDTQKLAARTTAQYNDQISELLKPHTPSVPVGFIAPRSTRYYWSAQTDSSFGSPSMRSSILERGIRELYQLPANGRYYYAISGEASEIVPIGIASARQESGFHVIKGTW